MKEIFNNFFRMQTQKVNPDKQNNQLAMAKAVLLTHVVGADEKIDINEWKEIGNILQKRLNLEEHQTNDIQKKAIKKYQEANDIYQFCMIVKKHLGREQRIQFVKDMLTAACSDGELAFSEDHAIWKISELLGIETPERVKLRKEIKQQNQNKGE